MNLVGETGNAGAVAFGGPQKTAPANPSYTVGEIGFGPTWSDDEVQLTHAGWKRITDGMAQSIIRLEQALDEARAENTLLLVERGLLERELRKLRETIADFKAQRHE